MGTRRDLRIIERVIEALVFGGALVYMSLKWPDVYMKSWFAVLIAAILTILLVTSTVDRKRWVFTPAHPRLRPELQLALVGITWLSAVIATPWNDPWRYPLQWLFCVAISIAFRKGFVWIWWQLQSKLTS